VLYVVALNRMRRDLRTQAYVAKRTVEGKSKREIMRCLKRYIAREVYRQLIVSRPELAPGEGLPSSA
jgi:transposase